MGVCFRYQNYLSQMHKQLSDGNNVQEGWCKHKALFKYLTASQIPIRMFLMSSSSCCHLLIFSFISSERSNAPKLYNYTLLHGKQPNRHMTDNFDKYRKV